MINYDFIINYFGNIDNVLNLTTKIFAIIIILESLELLSLKKYLKSNGIWTDEVVVLKYNTLKKDNIFYNNLINICIKLLKYKQFVFLLYLELILGILLLFINNSILLLIIIFIKIIISIKWNGSFNGGSDSMGMVLAIGIFVSLIFPTFSQNSNFQIAGIVYINYNLIISYFRAGIVKIKNRGWLTGKELQIFTKNTIFKNEVNENLIFKITSNQKISMIASIIMILWEITFIISLFDLNLAIIFISFGVIFHFLNFYIFGLNRFFFNWLATYPSLIYLSILFN